MALTDNLQAFYKLSDLSDSSGNNRTLTNNGNVSFASGKIGNAAVFDGSNYLSKADFSVTDFSVSFWCKIPTLQDANPLVDFYPKLGLETDSIGRISTGDFSSFNTWSDAGVILANEWHHIVATIVGTTATLYVNNVLITSDVNEAYGNSNSRLAIPVMGFQGNERQIDAVGIWNRALSDAEVAELYNNGTGLELDGVAQPTLVKMQAPVKFFGKVKFGV